MTVKLTLKLDEGQGLAEQEDLPASGPTGVVAELAGILAGKDLDLSDQGRARYLARKAS